MLLWLNIILSALHMWHFFKLVKRIVLLFPLDTE